MFYLRSIIGRVYITLAIKAQEKVESVVYRQSFFLLQVRDILVRKKLHGENAMIGRYGDSIISQYWIRWCGA